MYQKMHQKLPSTTFVLKGSVSKKGTMSVFLRYAFAGTTSWLSTGVKIKPLLWDAKKEMVKAAEPMAFLHNKTLAKLKNDVQTFIINSFEENQFPTFARLKEKLDQGNIGSGLKVSDMLPNLDRMVESNKISAGTRKTYKPAINAFLDRMGDMPVAHLSPVIVAEFRSKLAKDSQNMAAQYTIFLRAAWLHLKKVHQLKMDDPFEFEDRTVVKISEKKTVLAEQYEQLKQHFIKTQNDTLRRFLILAKGIRYSDTNRIHRDMLNVYPNAPNVWYLNMGAQKTDVKGIVVLDQWDYDNLLIWREDGFLFKKLYSSQYNLQLKTITQKVIGVPLTSHYGRHYAGDMMINANELDRDDVKKLLGIKSDTVLNVYARKDVYKVIEKYLTIKQNERK
jgi:integrase